MIDDDDETTAIHLIFSQRKKERRIKWQHERCDWPSYVLRLRHSRSFDNKHRMPEDAFYQLVDAIRPSITVDVKKSMAGSNGNDPIYPEMICSIGVRWLAGEMERSLEDCFGLSRASVYRVIDRFLAAVIACDDLTKSCDYTRPRNRSLKKKQLQDT